MTEVPVSVVDPAEEAAHRALPATAGPSVARLSSLRARLLGLVTLALLPAFALISWNHYRYLLEQHDEARALSQRSAHSRAYELAEKFGEMEYVLGMIASVPAVREAVQRRDAPHAARCSEQLAAMNRAALTYATFGVALADGTLLCSAETFDRDRPPNYADRGWFRRAADSGRYAVGGYVFGRLTKKHLVVAALPLKDAQGKLEAVLFSALDLAWLAQFIADLRLPEAAALVVIDGEGKILARRPDHAQWVGQVHPMAATLLAAVQARDEGDIEVTAVDGVLRVGAYSRVPNTDLTVFYGLPKADAEAEANRTFARNLLAMAVILLTGFALAWAAAEAWLLRRTRRLSEVAERMAAGDLGARSGVAGGDEIGRLAAAFDHMTTAVAEREQRLARANRALRVLSAGNRALLRGDTVPELLDSACRILVDTGGYRLAWVGRAEHDAAQSVRVVAACGDHDHYLDRIEVVWADAPHGRGPTGRAIRCGEPVVARRIQTDPACAPWREAAMAQGFAASLALPLRMNGEVFGALSIYAADADAFDHAELELLKEMADDVSFGLRTLKLREEKAAVDADLRALNAELEARIAERTAELAAALAESEDLYEHAPCGYHSLDGDGRILRMNATELGWLGYPRDEVVGRLKMSELMTPVGAEVFRQKFPLLIERGVITDTEVELRRKDGSLLPVSINATVVRDAAGRFLRTRTTVFDVTERRRAREEMQRANVELQQASRMKSHFLANMSHELRTPLNAIIGFSEVLHDGLAGEVTPRQREYLHDILASGTHLLSLINDILDLSKVEAGKMELDLGEVAVEPLLRATLGIVREKAMAHRLALELAVAEDAGSLVADERKLKQIVYNLLSNAVKFTADGGRVAVSARRVPLSAAPAEAVPPADAEAWLEIAVHDSGVGISAEDQARLFSPFTQIDSTLARRYDGTGLGLTLVRRFAELHGGSVGVASAPGAGATFRVWLPVRPTIRPTMRQPAS